MLTITSLDITEIDIQFAAGSFAEWTQSNGDMHPSAWISEWERQYNQIIKSRIEALYPHATVTVGEGGLTGQVTFEWGSSEIPENYDSMHLEIQEAAMASNDDNELMEQLWGPPSIEAIAESIIQGLEDKPIFKLEYLGAEFAFIQSGENFWWLDLGIDHIFDEDSSWCFGTVEQAAIAWREDWDTNFKLITQAEAAKLAGVSASAISNAIREGRLKAYEKLGNVAHKPGGKMVNQIDVIDVWWL